VFLALDPGQLRASIKRVCADMYEGYTNAVKEEVARFAIAYNSTPALLCPDMTIDLGLDRRALGFSLVVSFLESI